MVAGLPFIRKKIPWLFIDQTVQFRLIMTIQDKSFGIQTGDEAIEIISFRNNLWKDIT